MSETATKEKFTLVLFSGEFNKVLTAFRLATTAGKFEYHSGEFYEVG